MLATIIIGSIVAVIFVAIIVSQVRKIKSGKGFCSCGGSCGGCAMKDLCHKTENE